jgi:hypothetical protein
MEEDSEEIDRVIRGIEKFKEYFTDYKAQYVLIGGAACDLILSETLIPPRATKDLDIVLIVEALTPEFGAKFWEFIHDGGYKNRLKNDGKPQYYRFTEPAEADFPFMIELMSRTDSAIDREDGGIVPIHMDDSLSSLSAILLNDEYYKLILESRTEIDGVIILPPEMLIVLKAKAWLDLTERKARGEHVNSDDIKKHRSDIVRLVLTLAQTESIRLPELVYADIEAFIAAFEKAPLDPASMGIKNVSVGDVVSALKGLYA